MCALRDIADRDMSGGASRLRPGVRTVADRYEQQLRRWTERGTKGITSRDRSAAAQRRHYPRAQKKSRQVGQEPGDPGATPKGDILV
jgi:hypothetical protein